ncbi:hypothetical protein GCM10011391_06990 [Pullulanibacillus camelliae]|uniref:Amidohydrolase-related domain-containing protein n=1 Tax=Pullulanibacillus camelliae TaxID=1707096 RepID=A0A8J2YF71_9BACL|nr:amidohydrolase family protein [Pullulanibacillus camelliae]GGE30939.1 hypothetical protein GCM10011391_06990 [Pullulanibacillus camelliae]
MIKHLIDFHTHFPVDHEPHQEKRSLHPEVLHYKKELRRIWREQFKFDDPETEHPGNAVQLQRWKQEVTTYDIQKVVFVTGGGNQVLSDLIKDSPEFIGFAHHDLSEDGAYEKLKFAVEELGLSGYKWFGPLMRKPFDSPELKPFWTYLNDHRLPCLIHFGVLGGPGGTVYHPYINPLTIGNVVQTYVDIPFVFPHFGAGYWQELLQLAWSSPNVYVDSSGSNDWVRWMPYPLTLTDLFQKAYETIGPQRMIFGTDSNNFPRGFSKRYLDLQEAACLNIGMSKEDMQKFFGGNAARLLKISQPKSVVIE